MKYTKRLTWLTSFYGQAAAMFPIIVAAPQYFAGQIQLGTLTQTADAFAQVQKALSWFVDTYPRLAAWKAVVDRLTTFSEAMAKAKVAAARQRLRGRARSAAARSWRWRPWRCGCPTGRRCWRTSTSPCARASRPRARALGQRQDHAVPRARRPVAVRPRPHAHAAGRARPVPAAEALSADRHAQGRAVLSRGARRAHRRGCARGARRLRARASRRRGSTRPPTGRWCCPAASSSASPSRARCSIGPTGCSSTKQRRRWTRRRSARCMSF